MDPVIASIPFTAWEQAVFVALFIVLVLGLLAWFSKQSGKWQDFIERQNDRWQRSVDYQNAQWQTWMNEQNKRDTASMDKVIFSIQALTRSIETHDDKVEDRFNSAITEVRKNGEKIARIKPE